MADAVLTINAGSSSLKFSVYRIAERDRLELSAKGQVEGIGTAPHLVAEDAEGKVLVDRRFPNEPSSGHDTFFRVVGGWLREHFGDRAALLGVGHRVVHGGTEFTAPVRVTPAVLAQLEALCPLAPLHQPHNLGGIRAVAAVQPELPQVACFDTAFHRSHPELADWFALPRRFYDDGVRRYGFHGLSYEYIASVLPEVAPEIAGGRVVIAHLGSGASMCAIKAGRSQDSTMGFTALDGARIRTTPMGLRKNSHGHHRPPSRRNTPVRGLDRRQHGGLRLEGDRHPPRRPRARWPGGQAGGGRRLRFAGEGRCRCREPVCGVDRCRDCRGAAHPPRHAAAEGHGRVHAEGHRTHARGHRHYRALWPGLMSDRTARNTG
jgi:Acetokinase family